MKFKDIKDFIYKDEAGQGIENKGRSGAADPVSDIKPPRQWHVLPIFLVICLVIPVVMIVGDLLEADKAKDMPVEGVRFAESLDQRIDQSIFPEVVNEIKSWDKVEDATINLRSATLRVHVNLDDDISSSEFKAVKKKVWKYIKEKFPLDVYFTNKEGCKMYDLEVDVYNFIPDDEHPSSKQLYHKIVKTGAAKKATTDYISSAKDKALVKEIVREEKE